MIPQEDIENRLEKLAALHEKIGDLVENLPVEIPSWVKEKLLTTLVGDHDLRELIDGIKGRRPPRFILVGRTGVGKSSLINAMCGRYLAETSDVEPGTSVVEKHAYNLAGKTLFEVLDTRGIGESTSAETSAQEDLVKAIEEFCADAVLFLVRAKGRDYVDKDIQALKDVITDTGVKVPIVAVLAQVDELEPAREKEPASYTAKKKKNIRDAIAQLKATLNKNEISPLGIMPVSSYVEWDRDSSTVEMEEWHELQIAFDGRHNIDDLLDLLENNIPLEAAIRLMLSTRVDKVAEKFANRFGNVFSGLSATVALTPIPIADIYILCALQMLLITIVAYLGGRDLSNDSAKEFLVALGGIGAGGFALRTAFQQGSKLVNLLYPGVGSALSAAVAAGGTYATGKAAIAYFIHKVPKNQLEDIASEARDEYEQDSEPTP